MNQPVEIEYNTGKEPILYPEYGRGIQELLRHARGIEEPRRRQKTVESIVHMMQILNPNKGNLEEYRERLWNHAFAIAEYQLDVTPPNGIVITRPEDRVVPQAVVYPTVNSRFRHYGTSVQKLIAKAIEMPDGPKKEGFVEVIASYMKLAYKTWNKEHFVSDDQVKEDLTLLSDGQLELHEGHSSLDTLAISAIKMEKEMQRKQRAQKYKQLNAKRKPTGGSPRSTGGGGGRSNNSGSGGNKQRRRK